MWGSMGQRREHQMEWLDEHGSRIGRNWCDLGSRNSIVLKDVYLNVLRSLDIPTTLAMVAERCGLRLYGADPAGWTSPAEVVKKLDWEKGLRGLK